MMNLIPHGGLVHMPLALALLVPLLYAMAWISEHRGWLNKNIWFVVAIFSVVQLLSIFVALESGEAAEFASAATKAAIELHEEAAEKFLDVWIALGVLLVGSLWFRGRNYFWIAEVAVLSLFAAQLYLAFKVGHLGGELK